MDHASQRGITFRCPPELETILPRPIPAVLGLPDWFKALPQKAFSETLRDDLFTMKKCPPVIDAMTFGFLMPLACDLKVENGEFTWQRDLPAGIAKYSRSPIDFHDGCQVAGTPFFDEDRFIIKFNNFWTIELPPGYSLLVTHPINRDDLPFSTLSGLVDAFRSLPKHYLRCGGKTVLERVSRALGYESGELAADSRVGSMIGVKGY